MGENNLTNAHNNNTNGILRREVTRAGGFNFAGFRFRFGVVLTTHQRPQDQQPPQQPQQQPPNNNTEASEAENSSTEASAIDSNNTIATIEDAAAIEDASTNREETSESSFEEIEGAAFASSGEDDATTISKLEEVKEDLRQVSEALKPFVSKSDDDNEHLNDCDQDQQQLEHVENS